MMYRFEDAKRRPLNIRATPSPDGELVGQIASGSEFDAEPDGDWLMVGPGYVMAQYCELAEQTGEPMDEEPVEVPSEEEIVSDEEPVEDSLENMTTEQLRELAKDSDIKLQAGMKKADIIKALLDA